MSSLQEQKDRDSAKNRPAAGRYGAVDIGSHTIRLLIAEFDGRRQLKVLLTRRSITRLAGGFHESGKIRPRSLARSFAVLDGYARLLAKKRVSSTACGATGVLRRAAEARLLVEQARCRCGLRVEILSERQEAVLSAKGALSMVETGGKPVLCFDLGGSSTEFVLAVPERQTPLFAESVFIGAATLTQRFLASAPNQPGQVRRARQFVETRLEPVVREVQRQLVLAESSSRPPALVGTAGTVTTLAAMNLKLERYRPSCINGTMLSRPWIDATIDWLSRRELEQRLQWSGLEKGREDIIVAGAVIVSTILRSFGRQDLIVADGGLLEGLLLDDIHRNHGLDPPPLWTPLTWLWESE